MSKMYNLNRMQYAAAAGGLGTIIKGAGRLIGGLFKSGAAKRAGAAAVKMAKSPIAQTAAMVAAGSAASGLLQGGGKESSGASGSWGVRRRRGITATELRGFRKVANLIHKEGMVVKRARGRH